MSFLATSAAIDPSLDALFKTSIEKSKSAVAPPPPPKDLFTPVIPLVTTERETGEKRKAEDDSSVSPQSASKPTTTFTEPRKPRLKKAKLASDPEEKCKRTVFVGNVPAVVATEKSHLSAFKALFRQHGAVESIRFRSVALDKPAVGKMRKIGVLQGNLHPNRDTLHAYIVYKQESSAQDACKARNATVFEGKHLRVDLAHQSQKAVYDTKRTVFVGNLPFDVQEESLWTLFSVCGDVTGVRVVRDAATNIGKGIAYVEFRDRLAVGLALKLDGEKQKWGRSLRVSRCEKKGESGPQGGKGKKVGKTAVEVKKGFEGERAVGRAEKKGNRKGVSGGKEGKKSGQRK